MPTRPAGDSKPRSASPAGVSAQPTPTPGARPARRLGRGLSALLDEPVAVAGTIPPAEQPASSAATSAPADPPHADPPHADPSPTSDAPHALPLDAIAPGVNQPRTRFDEASLEGLAQSIRSAGVMQPVVVRPIAPDADAPDGVRWELIAGERRWRAARLAGLTAVPAVIAAITDQQAAEWSLVENLQREDLNPIERAEAFRRLAEDFGLSHAQIASRVGLDRSTVTNLIRLMELEQLIRDEVAAGRLSAGHARALLGLPAGPARVKTALRARDGGWSVRRLEQFVQQGAGPSSPDAPPGDRPEPNPAREASRRDLERRLADRLGARTRVRLDAAGLRGRIVVEFFDLDHLDGVLARMGLPAGGID